MMSKHLFGKIVTFNFQKTIMIILSTRCFHPTKINKAESQIELDKMGPLTNLE